MAPEQKQAWFIVAVFLLALVCFLCLIPLVGLKVAPAGFGIFGFGGFAPLIGRKKRDPQEVLEDERDKTIAHKATLGGALLSYETFIFACMIPWFVYYKQGMEEISIHALPLIVGAGGIVFFISRAVILLILYGRGGNHVT